MKALLFFVLVFSLLSPALAAGGAQVPDPSKMDNAGGTFTGLVNFTAGANMGGQNLIVGSLNGTPVASFGGAVDLSDVMNSSAGVGINASISNLTAADVGINASISAIPGADLSDVMNSSAGIGINSSIAVVWHNASKATTAMNATILNLQSADAGINATISGIDGSDLSDVMNTSAGIGINGSISTLQGVNVAQNGTLSNLLSADVGINLSISGISGADLSDVMNTSAGTGINGSISTLQSINTAQNTTAANSWHNFTASTTAMNGTIADLGASDVGINGSISTLQSINSAQNNTISYNSHNSDVADTAQNSSLSGEINNRGVADTAINSSKLALAGGNMTGPLGMGGNAIRGSTSASGTLNLTSTTSATKGKIFFGSGSVFDEANGRLGIGITAPTNAVHVVGPVYATTYVAAGTKLYSMTTGTAALPSIYSGSDSNTGIWNPASDSIGLSTAGVNRLTIGANGLITLNGSMNVNSKILYGMGTPVNVTDAARKGDVNSADAGINGSISTLQAVNIAQNTTASNLGAGNVWQNYTIANLAAADTGINASIASGIGGIGSYSAIVYVNSTTILAKDAAGNELDSGTKGTDDDTVIQAAIDYVNGIGGGKVFIRKPPLATYSSTYLLDALINIKIKVHVEVEDGTVFTPTTNNNIFQLHPGGAFTCPGRCQIRTSAYSGWSAIALLLDGNADTGDGIAFYPANMYAGIISGIDFFGYVGAGHGTALKFYSNGAEGVPAQVQGINVDNCAFYGFEKQIWLHKGNTTYDTSFINQNHFNRIIFQGYYDAIFFQNDLGTAADTDGNMFHDIDFERGAGSHQEITVSGNKNIFTNVFMWDMGAAIGIKLAAPAGTLPYASGPDWNYFAGMGLKWDNPSTCYGNRIDLYSDNAGAAFMRVKTISTAITYAATDDNEVILCNTAAGDIIIALPVPFNRYYTPITIKKTTDDVNTVTINQHEYEYVEGGTSFTLPGGVKNSVTLRADTNGDWWVI